MKFTIDIDDIVLQNNIQGILVENAVKGIEQKIFNNDSYSYMRKLYRDDIHSNMLTVIRAHEDEIIEKAVAEAASILARKAMPKMMERMMNDD